MVIYVYFLFSDVERQIFWKNMEFISKATKLNCFCGLRKGFHQCPQGLIFLTKLLIKLTNTKQTINCEQMCTNHNNKTPKISNKAAQT